MLHTPSAAAHAPVQCPMQHSPSAPGPFHPLSDGGELSSVIVIQRKENRERERERGGKRSEGEREIYEMMVEREGEWERCGWSYREVEVT